MWEKIRKICKTQFFGVLWRYMYWTVGVKQGSQRSEISNEANKLEWVLVPCCNWSRCVFREIKHICIEWSWVELSWADTWVNDYPTHQLYGITRQKLKDLSWPFDKALGSSITWVLSRSAFFSRVLISPSKPNTMCHSCADHIQLAVIVVCKLPYQTKGEIMPSNSIIP